MTEHEITIFAAWDQDANLKLSFDSIETAKKELVNLDGTPSSCHAAQVSINLPTWTQSKPPLTDPYDQIVVLPNAAEARIEIYQRQNGQLRDSSEIDFYLAWTFWSGDSVEVGASEESEEDAVEDLEASLPEATESQIEVRVLVVIKPREMDEVVMPTAYVK